MVVEAVRRRARGGGAADVISHRVGHPGLRNTGRVLHGRNGALVNALRRGPLGGRALDRALRGRPRGWPIRLA